MQHCHPILPPVCRVQAQEIALREKGKALTDEDVIQVSFRFFFCTANFEAGIFSKSVQVLLL